MAEELGVDERFQRVCSGLTRILGVMHRDGFEFDKDADLAAEADRWLDTRTPARAEVLRAALSEARDAMQIMSSWVRKSDPAGHSWAVRMVDRANAVLAGAQVKEG